MRGKFFGQDARREIEYAKYIAKTGLFVVSCVALLGNEYMHLERRTADAKKRNQIPGAVDEKPSESIKLTR